MIRKAYEDERGCIGHFQNEKWSIKTNIFCYVKDESNKIQLNMPKIYQIEYKFMKEYAMYCRTENHRASTSIVHG
jgi:hypothetical protein